MNITDLSILETVASVDVIGGRRNSFAINNIPNPPEPGDVNIQITPIIQIIFLNNLQIANIISLGDSINNIEQSVDVVTTFLPTFNMNS